MSDRTTPHDSKSTVPVNRQADILPEDVQPESGFIDREDRMEVRQSSPTNPRVSEKSEMNQEEA